LGVAAKITNGGAFGSLLSTPVINPPQTGILGILVIQERPVATPDMAGKTWVNVAVKEHLAEKYTKQDMIFVAGSFEIQLARAISEKPTLAQNQSRGV